MLIFRYYHVCVFLIVNFLLSCGVSVKVANGFEIKKERLGRIRILGEANDAKGGAIVISDDGSTYYVGHKQYWKAKHLDDSVKVSGRVILITYTKLDSTRIVQHIVQKKIIKRPIYRFCD